MNTPGIRLLWLSLLLHAPSAGAVEQLAGAPGLQPFTGPRGLPGLETGRLLRPGDAVWRIRGDIASHSARGKSATEEVEVDGETYRVSVSWHKRISRRLELGLTVPFDWWRAGELDDLIEGWHNLTGLPNGERGRQPEDRLQITYRNAAGADYRLRRAVDGIGAIRLHAGLALYESDDSALALRASWQPGNGTPERLTGGESALAVQLAYERQMSRWPAAWTVNAGVVRNDDNGLFHELARDVTVVAGFGLGYTFTARWSMQGTVTWHDRIFATGLDELGGPALIGGLSLAWHFRPAQVIEIGFSEDLRVDTSPDLGMHIAWRRNARP